MFARKLQRFTLLTIIASVICFSLPNNPVFSQQAKPFDTNYFADSGGMVMAVRPRAIFSLEEFAPLGVMFNSQTQRMVGLKTDQIEQFMLSMYAPDPNAKMRFFLRATDEINGEKYLMSLTNSKQAETIEFRGESYFKAQMPQRYVPAADGKVEEPKPRFLCCWQPDEKAAVVGSEDEVKQYISKQKASHKLLKEKSWQQVHQQTAAMTMDTVMLEGIKRDIDRNAKAPEELGVLIETITHASFGAQVGKELKLVGYVYCNSPTDSRKAKEAIEGLVEMVKPLMKMQVANIGKGRESEAQSMEMMMDLLDKLEITRNGNVVKLASGIEAKAFGQEMSKAAGSARISAQRAQSMNNGKQMGLAFHNYADTFKKFPAAVGIGPKGHKYSWRVAILPFIEQQALYDQYNFEEPWDSETNLKVLAQMPDAFRNPMADKDSTETSYQAFVGPDTLFWKEGATFADVVDGTSNTIMYVESKKAIPWTKPEDIQYDPFDPEKLAPKLGGYYEGGFNAVFADGSVRFISNEVDNAELHSMIQISDQANAAKE